MATLSKNQKGTLCKMAAKAFHMAGAAAGFASVDSYRRAICKAVTGKDGLTKCTNSDYVPLYNTFAAIIGKEQKPAEDKITHLAWCIRDALKKFELREAYAQHIAADRLHVDPATPLETLLRMLGPEGAQQVLYTINTRGRAHVRQVNERLGLPADACQEPHTSRATMAPGRLADHLNQVYCPPPPAPVSARPTRQPKRPA